jgi:hypothetical protein
MSPMQWWRWAQIAIMRFLASIYQYQKKDEHVMPSVKYNPASWNEIYDQLTDYTFDNLLSEDRILLMRYIMRKLQIQYPTEFQEAFEPQPEPVAPVSILQQIEKSIGTKPTKKKNNPIIESENFEKLGTQGKQKKIISEDKRKWISEHL